MRKILSLLLFVVLGFGILSCSGGTRRTSRCLLRVKLTSTSKIAYGSLYINGIYRGLVYRNKTKYFRAQRGKWYSFKVTRVWDGSRWYRYRRVYVSYSSTSKWIFLHPMRQRSSGEEGL